MNEKKDKGLEKITNLSEEYIKEFQSKDKEENEVIKEIAEGIKKEKPEITEKKETADQLLPRHFDRPDAVLCPVFGVRIFQSCNSADHWKYPEYCRSVPQLCKKRQ